MACNNIVLAALLGLISLGLPVSGNLAEASAPISSGCLNEKGGGVDVPEAQTFAQEIIQLVRNRNLQGLFSLVDGELTTGPRKKFALSKGFSFVFPEQWRSAILAEPLSCRSVGERGFMLADGKLWFEKRDGKWQIIAINGAHQEDVPAAGLPAGWQTTRGLIPPQCFVRLWISGDNFDEFENKYLIDDREDFKANPGLYLGKIIPLNAQVSPSWNDGPGQSQYQRLVLAAPLQQCFSGTLVNGELGQKANLDLEVNGQSVMAEHCDSQGLCSKYEYRLLASIPPKQCRQYAPSLKAECRDSFLVEVGRDSGGSAGWIYQYIIYGLFSNHNKADYLVPLRIFWNRNQALDHVKQ